jgi:hypothetical protein
VDLNQAEQHHHLVAQLEVAQPLSQVAPQVEDRPAERLAVRSQKLQKTPKRLSMMLLELLTVSPAAQPLWPE